MNLQSVDVAADVVHVRAVGQIAPTPEEQLRDPFVSLLGTQIFSKHVSLDLSDAEFISSSGIGWLLHLHKQFEANRGRLTLNPVSREVNQVLRLMRLESVLHLSEASA